MIAFEYLLNVRVRASACRYFVFALILWGGRFAQWQRGRLVPPLACYKHFLTLSAFENFENLKYLIHY